MEITELVSFHIAAPVIGVVVCAIMVFACGFRSPVQPPSFIIFEEEKKSKRRTKQIKSKGPVNGHVATNETTPEPAPKATPKSSREGRLTPATKEKLSESKTVTKKEVKQDTVGDKKKKTKKETVAEEVKAESGKKNKSGSVRKEAEDGGEWTTIQVSKKSKKQKPTSKKDGGQAESAVEADSEPETSPVPVSDAAAAAASPALTSEVEESSSPQINKRKKKKEKSTEKNRAEEKEELPAVSVVEKPELTTAILAQTQDLGESKKKKNKKEKKLSAGADAAAASENIIQDAASASGKTGKKQSSSPRIAEPTYYKKESSPPRIAEPIYGKTESSPPQIAEPIYGKKESSPPQIAEHISAQVAAPANTEQAKPSPKKKKSKGKENIQEEKSVKAADAPLKQVERPAEPVKKDADIQLKEVEKPVEPVKKDDEKKKTKATSKALKVEAESAVTPVSVAESADTTGSAAANQASAGLTFDEIGDSWQEAAPKSKKKKPRRDN
ncbi:hypothetical protein BsWGS_03057 [Bradybaena similaris]